jgi:hypothetical protein
MKCQQEYKLRTGAFLPVLIKYNFTKKSRGILGGIKWVYVLPLFVIIPHISNYYLTGDSLLFYSPSPEYPVACRSVAEIPPSGATGMNGKVNPP